ncbi:MAG: E2/UBC family protein [Fimbriimonadales bacterium]
MNQRVQRILKETALAAVRYSATHSAQYDDEEGSWVIIKDFPLPEGYSDTHTDVLILLPKNYPQTPPDWFYVDDELTLENGDEPDHMFYDDTSVDPNFEMFEDTMPQLRGWTGCCLHIREWKPAADPLQGHSLLSVCELIKQAFERWR